MKFCILFLTLISFLLVNPSSAQPLHVYTVAGVPAPSYSGDGGPAIQAAFDGPNVICVDKLGNLFIGDYENKRIRKVTAATGIVNTIAGTGTTGFSGDGGPGISAQISHVYGMYCDSLGNLFFTDVVNYRVRRVDAVTGIITTVAGNGNNTNSGDGGLATNAGLGYLTGLVLDKEGNIYFGSEATIRKINVTTGIITTIAGSGIVGYGGDGGPATLAQLQLGFTGLAFDSYGNLFLTDVGNHRIRKIDKITGIITSIAGTGIPGFSGDGLPATLAEFYTLRSIYFDLFDNLYIADYGTVNPWDGKIRKIDRQTGVINTIAGQVGGSVANGAPAISTQLNPLGLCVDFFGNVFYAHNHQVRRINTEMIGSSSMLGTFKAFAFNTCSNGTPHFAVTMTNYVPGYSVKTYYSDGTSDVHNLINAYNSGFANFDHVYSTTGNYRMKHVLYNGINPVDSLTYPFEYRLCNTQTLAFYTDLDNDCDFDNGTDIAHATVKTIAIDSNGINIDTLSVMGAFHYNAFGQQGDIYDYHLIESMGGTIVSCPLTGIVSNTISIGSPELLTVGFECSTGTDYDMILNDAFTITAANRAELYISTANLYCAPQNGMLSLTFSPKYIFTEAYPPPSTQNGNTVTWNMPNLDLLSGQKFLHINLSYNGLILTPGDTVHTTVNVNPTNGDVIVPNNMIVKQDTVTGPYDPNAIYVTPSSCVVPGSELKYTITFENLGNDTAQNVYIMDTVSAGFEMQSMRLVAASHPMNISKIKNGGFDILKFEFPGINLADSSSPARHGFVSYTIDMNSNFPIGSSVTNKAGIYFDYMPAVLTNVSTTATCWPANVNDVRVSKIGIRIYPNPAIDELLIQTDKEYNTLTITNTLGQVMLSSDVNGKETEINITDLSAGIYYVTLKGLGAAEVRKFVKL